MKARNSEAFIAEFWGVQRRNEQTNNDCSLQDIIWVSWTLTNWYYFRYIAEIWNGAFLVISLQYLQFLRVRIFYGYISHTERELLSVFYQLAFFKQAVPHIEAALNHHPVPNTKFKMRSNKRAVFHQLWWRWFHPERLPKRLALTIRTCPRHQ